MFRNKREGGAERERESTKDRTLTILCFVFLILKRNKIFVAFAYKSKWWI